MAAALEVWLLGLRAWRGVLTWHPWRTLLTSLETPFLRSVSSSIVLASVGLSHSLHFLSVFFCVFLRILDRKGRKKAPGEINKVGALLPWLGVWFFHSYSKKLSLSNFSALHLD